MGNLTPRGEALAAGLAALATADGDDALVSPDQSTESAALADTERNGETEETDPESGSEESGATDPARSPDRETSDDLTATERETRA